MAPARLLCRVMDALPPTTMPEVNVRPHRSQTAGILGTLHQPTGGSRRLGLASSVLTPVAPTLSVDR
jgi:hypothetical protein